MSCHKTVQGTYQGFENLDSLDKGEVVHLENKLSILDMFITDSLPLGPINDRC